MFIGKNSPLWTQKNKKESTALPYISRQNLGQLIHVTLLCLNTEEKISKIEPLNVPNNQILSFNVYIFSKYD